MTPRAVDVVVVAYRSRELLRRCLDSLVSHRPQGELNLFVVDNASGDGTVELLGDRFPDVWLHAAADNLGFAKATNIGIRAGKAPYVLVLNPDTEATSGALDRMLDLMDAQPQIGIAGCRLELEDGSLDHAAKRSFPTPLSALGHFSGLGLGSYTAPDVVFGPVDAVNGAFMLIRRAALEEVGLFDEGYWMYMEDLDLCYRFCEAGWLTWYEPSVTVMHLKGGTSGPIRSPRLHYAFHYGMFRFYRKHYAARHSRVMNVAVYAGIAGKLAISVARSGLRRTVARRRPARIA
jgi:N-acetylglucosaminyl-diphospho-decaprenol L-rhamnosyltransferase